MVREEIARIAQRAAGETATAFMVPSGVWCGVAVVLFDPNDGDTRVMVSVSGDPMDQQSMLNRLAEGFIEASQLLAENRKNSGRNES